MPSSFGVRDGVQPVFAEQTPMEFLHSHSPSSTKGRSMAPPQSASYK